MLNEKKIKIIKCSNDDYWWGEHIGKIATVYSENLTEYVIDDFYGDEACINKCDCELLKNENQITMKNIKAIIKEKNFDFDNNKTYLKIELLEDTPDDIFDKTIFITEV